MSGEKTNRFLRQAGAGDVLEIPLGSAAGEFGADDHASAKV